MYFTYLASSNKAANSLQKQALAFLEAESNILVKQPNDFIDLLQQQIKKLNSENPRCKPLEVYTYGGSSKNTVGISLGSNFTVGFSLYRVKNPSLKEENHDGRINN